MSGGDELKAALAQLVGQHTSVAVWGVDVVEHDVRPDEAAAVASAVPKRRREFEKGRACARAALRAVGGPDVSIPVGPAREPVWPEGFVGTITHCGSTVAAAVSTAQYTGGLGIDVERADAVDAEVLETVLTPAEREEVASIEAVGATLRFSAKESIHKAIFPASRVWLDLQDVTIRPTSDSQHPLLSDVISAAGDFVVVPESDRARTLPWEELRGGWADLGEQLVTVATWRTL
jgi:4'-phosphopantetheinyl transferase EntD